LVDEISHRRDLLRLLLEGVADNLTFSGLGLFGRREVPFSLALTVADHLKSVLQRGDGALDLSEPSNGGLADGCVGTAVAHIRLQLLRALTEFVSTIVTRSRTVCNLVDEGVIQALLLLNDMLGASHRAVGSLSAWCSSALASLQTVTADLRCCSGSTCDEGRSRDAMGIGLVSAQA